VERVAVADKFNLWIRMLHHQWAKVHHQKWNLLGCTVGLPRTGKSVFTAFTCWLLNQNFDFKTDLIYTPKQLSTRIQDLETLGQVGSTTIADEMGCTLPAREFYKIQNREISKMLQTVGHLRPIMFFVAPDFSYIDSQPRKIFHWFFECTNRNERYVKVKPFQLSVNRKKGTLYFKYPRVTTRWGLMRITSIEHYTPPLEFIKEYEKYSNPEKTSLRKQGHTDMNEEKKKKFTLKEIQDFVITNSSNFVNEHGAVDYTKVMGMFGDHFKFASNPQQQAMTVATACNQILIKKSMQEEEKQVYGERTKQIDVAINTIFQRYQEKQNEAPTIPNQQGFQVISQQPFTDVEKTKIEKIVGDKNGLSERESERTNEGNNNEAA